jgi:hypothetical protein
MTKKKVGKKLVFARAFCSQPADLRPLSIALNASSPIASVALTAATATLSSRIANTVRRNGGRLRVVDVGESVI